MTTTEGPDVAREAGLRYVTDTVPGIRRIKKGRSFSYVGPDGKAIADRDEIARIKSLAIPPAYTDVWICSDRRGHIQATGRDARGRKQYRYHPRWRAVRDETKFDRMVAFAKALPKIRAAVARDLALRGLPREKVLATVVTLLERTAIRVGNDEYARDNASYGLTTLEERHVDVHGNEIVFHFRGKSGKTHEVRVRDARLAKNVRALEDLPGQHLFDYLDDDGERHPVRSDDVNAYLREVSGEDITAKDFRTWEATLGCALELAAVAGIETVAERKRVVKEAIAKIAERLGNTPTVCKKSYVHPGIVDRFLRDGAIELVQRAVERADPHALDTNERAVVQYVENVLNAQEPALSDVLARSVRAERAKRKTPARHRAAAPARREPRQPTRRSR